MKYFLRGFVLFVLVSFTSLAHAETTVYFSPNGGSQAAVLKELGKAQKSIDVAMFAFTSREIAQALVAAKERKVRVRMVLDTAQLKDRFSKSRFLQKKDMNVRFHLGPGLMHDKFAVIDGQEVLTGSYNWTVSADKKNSENLLVITDKEIAEKYSKQFKHLWNQSGEGTTSKDIPSKDENK